MKQEKLLKNAATYTSSTESIKVVAQNIKQIRIGWGMLGTGTTATTLANTIAHSSAVKLTVGGEIISLIRHDDLFVLNYILEKWGLCEHPSWLMTTTTDNTYGWMQTILPVQITTDKHVYISLDYTGVTDSDTGTLDLLVEYGDKPYSSKPLSLQYISATAATSFAEYDLSQSGKKLLGLLVFGTTIPVTTTKTFSVSELKLLVKRREILHTSWYCMDQPRGTDVEDSALELILENYRFIDFSEDPIPADDLKVAFKSITATDAVRFIGIYQ